MNRKPAFIFIILTLIIDAMGIGLIIPVMPDLIRSVAGADLANAALWGGVLTTVFALMQFLFGPTVGSLSDWLGRRPVLLVSMLVMAVDYIVMGFATSIWALLVLRIIAGIAASTHSTAAAFISDISSPEEKAANFGMIGAAFGIGFVLGPAIGGLLGGFDIRAPFYAAAALAGANLIFGYFVLPETVTDKIRRPFDIKRANPLGALVQIRKLPGMGRLLVLFFLYEFGFYVYPAIWPYFTTAQFEWSPSMIGASLAAFGISIAFVEGFLIRVLQPRFGEAKLIVAAIMFSAVIFVVLAFIKSGTVTLILTPLAAMSGLAIPSMRALISKLGTDDQQGEIQGIISSVISLATIAAPLAMTSVFFFATDEPERMYLPGAPFLLATVLMVASIVVFWPILRKAD